MLGQFRNVLVLAAHPDDEMGCVGLLDRLTDNSVVDLLTFSACTDLNGKELLAEWDAATDLFGVRAQMFQLPNRHLESHRHIILDVLDGRRGYDLILTPATFDEHQDHATVTREAIRAYKHTTILGYELPFNTVREHRLSAYVKVDVDVKLAHAAIYKSQAHKPYMDPEYIEGLARMRGLQAGVEYAEAYEVIRWIM